MQYSANSLTYLLKVLIIFYSPDLITLYLVCMCVYVATGHDYECMQGSNLENCPRLVQLISMVILLAQICVLQIAYQSSIYVVTDN